MFFNDGIARWLHTASFESRSTKTEITERALELYLTLTAPEERPADFTVRPEVEELLARVTARSADSAGSPST